MEENNVPVSSVRGLDIELHNVSTTAHKIWPASERLLGLLLSLPSLSPALELGAGAGFVSLFAAFGAFHTARVCGTCRGERDLSSNCDDGSEGERSTTLAGSKCEQEQELVD